MKMRKKIEFQLIKLNVDATVVLSTSDVLFVIVVVIVIIVSVFSLCILLRRAGHFPRPVLSSGRGGNDQQKCLPQVNTLLRKEERKKEKKGIARIETWMHLHQQHIVIFNPKVIVTVLLLAT